VAATYNKHHLLPPGENRFTPGTERAVVSGISGKWGLEICKDMDFQRLSRQYSGDGVALLIVPASDFVDDGWLHGRMAILRGVESGFSIARSAKLGILTATDDRGRLLAQANTIGPSFATAVTNIPVRHDSTLYSRLGNWFAWVCAALLFVCLFLIARPRPERVRFSYSSSRMVNKTRRVHCLTHEPHFKRRFSDKSGTLDPLLGPVCAHPYIYVRLPHMTRCPYLYAYAASRS
jgi:hypothetical protein